MQTIFKNRRRNKHENSHNKSGKFLNFDQGKPGKVRENQFLQVLTTMINIKEFLIHLVYICLIHSHYRTSLFYSEIILSF